MEDNPGLDVKDVSDEAVLIDGSNDNPTQPATRKRRFSIKYFSP